MGAAASALRPPALRMVRREAPIAPGFGPLNARALVVAGSSPAASVAMNWAARTSRSSVASPRRAKTKSTARVMTDVDR
jgi:hypothetical protein